MTIVVISTAFSPTTKEKKIDKPKVEVSSEPVVNVTFSYFKMSDQGLIQIKEPFQVKASEYESFADNWLKQHGVKNLSYCCTIHFDEDACICIEKCCFWGGIEWGEICTEKTVDCAGSPQNPCD